jgi:A/G-specific adenine glycosylase
MDSKDDTFVKLILDWFKHNKREFSWRTLKLSPFQVLVAELMLQKTNASQVENIFPRFIENYPNPESIANISEDELAKLLQPLGLFNRRARDLKKTAEIILDLGNVIPSEKKELLKLPGVGDYIANSILCFAFNKKMPIIDANVGRVMKRIFSFPVKSAPSRDKKLAERMEELIPDRYFKEFNYAILDIAALICIPRKPRCEECLMITICDYYMNL